MKAKLYGLVAAAVTISCGGDKGLTDEDAVRIVYDNFQPSVDKIIHAALDAKAASSGANINPFAVNGTSGGTMTVSGTVAQGTGCNETMSVYVALDNFSDTGKVIYQTDNTSDQSKLQLNLSITCQPNDDTMSGNLDGPLSVDGDVEGNGVIHLQPDSDLADNDKSPITVTCTHVTGTVAVGDVSQSVDFVLPTDLSSLDAAQQEKCRNM